MFEIIGCFTLHGKTGCLYNLIIELKIRLKPRTDEQVFLDKFYLLVCTTKKLTKGALFKSWSGSIFLEATLNKSYPEIIYILYNNASS